MWMPCNMSNDTNVRKTSNESQYCPLLKLPEQIWQISSLQAAMDRPLLCQVMFWQNSLLKSIQFLFSLKELLLIIKKIVLLLLWETSVSKEITKSEQNRFWKRNIFNVIASSSSVECSIANGHVMIVNHVTFLWLVYVLHKTWNWKFSRRGRAETAKKSTIECAARAEVVFFFFFFFWTLSLPLLSVGSKGPCC